jgi:diaminopimelate decarboxylase
VTDAARVQGIPVTDLAREYGTPLYIYDADRLVAQFTRLRARLDPALDIFYSLKANPSLAVCAMLGSLGAGAEVSSLAELVTAQRAGVDPTDIVVPGPGKSSVELAACLEAGVHAIICESFGELALLDALAGERGTLARVALRVNPGFAVKTSTLTMGGKPRQFGIDEDQLLRHGPLRVAYPHIRVVGVHVYMGTRILDPAVVVENTTRILALAEELADRLDFPLEVVDVGGGLGVPYFDGEPELDRDLLSAGVNPVVAAFRARHPRTRLIMELGRYLVADAGTYVVGVRYVKTSMGENFAVTDGGTHHHMAAVGIGSFVKRNFPIALLSRPADAAPQPWTIAGPLCTPNDTLARNVELPPLRPGDLLGVRASGAYGPTASPGLFLSHGFPAEVLVHGGVAHLVRERDECADLLRKQRLPVLDQARAIAS